MTDTPLLADLLKNHLDSTGGSARALSDKIGASYPSVLAWMSKGGVPRKPEHREALRRELALAPDVFARVLAASSKAPIDIPGEGPLDLRQLLLRYLGERNLTERTFSDLAGIPYATLMGVTRRGAVPRGGTLEQLATAMGLDIALVRESATRTRDEAEAAGHAVEVTEEPDPRPATASFPAASAVEDSAPAAGSSLARRASERVAASGLSAAAYARTHELPYLALSRLLSSGEEPQDEAILAQLVAAFPPAPSVARPAVPLPTVPAEEGTRALHRSDDTAPPAGHPLHAALLRLTQQKGWNQGKFAQACNLAVPTAARLLKGELPGRGPTHQKLREVLGLDEAAYRALLPPTPEAGEEPSSSARRPAVKSETTEDPEVVKLSRAIRTLDDNQRDAVWKLVKTFKDGA